jgi:hypothetical protein
MTDIYRFAIFTIAAFALFLAVVLWVIRDRTIRSQRWSIASLAIIVVPLGMIFARYSHIFFHGLPCTIYYGVPALTTFVLPPLWLRMSRSETAWYVPLALLMAPTIHAFFSLVTGWHDYMPFPVYIPSVSELLRR